MKRAWDLFATTPPPIGYDPIALWPGGKTDPSFGVLKLTPWRIEVTSLADLMSGGGRVWGPLILRIVAAGGSSAQGHQPHPDDRPALVPGVSFPSS